MDTRNRHYVITEQGDLGLGAEVLNSKDQKSMNNYRNRMEDDDDSDDEDDSDD